MVFILLGGTRFLCCHRYWARAEVVRAHMRGEAAFEHCIRQRLAMPMPFRRCSTLMARNRRENLSASVISRRPRPSSAAGNLRFWTGLVPMQGHRKKDGDACRRLVSISINVMAVYDWIYDFRAA